MEGGAVIPETRHLGDDEWFTTCDEPECGVWRIGFTEDEARRLMVAHLSVAHKREVAVAE